MNGRFREWFSSGITRQEFLRDGSASLYTDHLGVSESEEAMRDFAMCSNEIKKLFQEGYDSWLLLPLSDRSTVERETDLKNGIFELVSGFAPKLCIATQDFREDPPLLPIVYSSHLQMNLIGNLDLEYKVLYDKLAEEEGELPYLRMGRVFLADLPNPTNDYHIV